MADFNKFCIIGRVVRDPEPGFTSEKTPYARMTLVTSRRYKNKSGDKEKSDLFIQTIAWGRKAEFINEYVTRATTVYAEGPLSRNKWTDKDGNEKEDFTLTINEIQLLSKKGGTNE